jgi:hypothetical protein
MGLQCLAADAGIWKLDQGQLEAEEPLMRARAVQRGLLPQEQPSFVLADIAGKGIPAALLMASLQGSLHGQCSDESKDLPNC